MAIDLKLLRKLETLPASALAGGWEDADRLVVLVKIREGSCRPDYVTVRSNISQRIFSAEIQADDLRRLQADPSVESFSLSRTVPIAP
jgi:hypothetical protein